MLFCGWWNAYLRLLWITISHIFVCLPTLELTTFEQQVRSAKTGYGNSLSLGKNRGKKRNVATLNNAHQAKNIVQLWQWLVWITTEQCTLLFLNFLNLRNLFSIWAKLKRSIIKNNNQINSTVTTRTWVFLKVWIRTFPSTRLISE